MLLGSVVCWLLAFAYRLQGSHFQTYSSLVLWECLCRSLRRLRLVLTDQEKSQPSLCIPSALGTALSALANRQQMLTMGSQHPTPTSFPLCSLAAGQGTLTAPCLSFPSCRCVKIVLCNLGEGYVIQYGDRFLLKGANQKLQT